MSEPRPALSLGVLTRDGLGDLDARHPLWAAIGEELPGWQPERWGPDERANRRWEDDPPPLPEGGAGELHARGRAAQIVVEPRTPRPDSTHGRVQILASPDVPDQEGPARLLRRLAVDLDADFGHVQMVSENDLGRLFDVFETEDGVRVSYAPWHLRFFLPGAYWGMVLGPAYVEMFGAECIAATPAHLVEQLRGDHFYLQLTAELSDPVDQPEQVDAARQGVLDHLGRDAFWQPGQRRPIMRRGQPIRPPGRAPTFAGLANGG